MTRENALARVHHASVRAPSPALYNLPTTIFAVCDADTIPDVLAGAEALKNMPLRRFSSVSGRGDSANAWGCGECKHPVPYDMRSPKTAAPVHSTRCALCGAVGGVPGVLLAVRRVRVLTPPH